MHPPRPAALARAIAALGLSLFAPTALLAATPAVLYDPAAASLPSAQGWAFLTDPLFIAQSRETLTEGMARLDSTAVRTEKAGWFSHLPPFVRHPRQPTLNAATGFVVSFQARILSEDHASSDRAGFSIIATAADLSSIELGFWTQEIWAQSGPDFQHAEGVPFDTTASRARYDLEIRDGRYRLSAAGTLLLQGNLRRYDSFGAPYHIPEFLFLGDDTTSAQAAAEVGRITVGALPRVAIAHTPEGIELTVDADPGREVLFERADGPSHWTEAGSATATATQGTARLVLSATGGTGVFRARLR